MPEADGVSSPPILDRGTISLSQTPLDFALVVEEHRESALVPALFSTIKNTIIPLPL